MVECIEAVWCDMNETFTSQPFGSQVASQRRRRPRCPQCGSNRFRRDPGTSLVVCDSGHVLQGFRDEETQDGDEFNSSRMQMHRRSLKRQGIERNRRVGRKRMSVATRGGEREKNQKMSSRCAISLGKETDIFVSQSLVRRSESLLVLSSTSAHLETTDQSSTA